jgi:hypothetical protein
MLGPEAMANNYLEGNGIQWSAAAPAATMAAVAVVIRPLEEEDAAEAAALHWT